MATVPNATFSSNGKTKTWSSAIGIRRCCFVRRSIDRKPQGVADFDAFSGSRAKLLAIE
jgi:hypothetical protein